MRRAGPSDRPAIVGHLGDRAVTSMFPLSNLDRYGMDEDHDRSMSFWIAEAAGRVTDVLGQTREGMVLPSFDTAPLDAAVSALTGREVIGVVGATATARPLIDRLGIGGAETELDADEPQFVLDLDALVIPEGEGALVPLSDVDRCVLTNWRTTYGTEALGLPGAKARAQAKSDIARYIAEDTHRVLVGPDGPLAMTGFNARIRGIVQIGGVFTPLDLRGRGHARRAVALHLDEVRASGTERATLFASGTAAVRAYEALGFRRIGDWTLFMLAGKERIGA